jgi:hypothetical protein
MPVTSLTPRLTRFAILAVAGATALSVAACGTSNNAKPTSSASPTSASTTSSTPGASAKGKDRVSGLIASVSGNAIQVTQQTGTATIDFTPSTKITEVTPAQLSDVTTGSCVTVRPTPEGATAPGGAVTAESVRVSQAVDGKCPQPETPAAGSTTTAPSGPPSGPAKPRPLSGTVASATGNTITVTGTDANGNPSQANVTVTDTTKYTQRNSATSQAIAQGKCITARGTKDGGGTLQATTINLKPADNGNCPQTGGKRHGG